MNKHPLLLIFLIIIVLSAGRTILPFITSKPLCLAFLLKYQIRPYREKLQSMLVFGKYDQALWVLTLADKRLTEARTLIQCQNIKQGMWKIEMAKEQNKLAQKYFKEAEETGEDMNYLKFRLEENSKNLLDIIREIE